MRPYSIFISVLASSYLYSQQIILPQQYWAKKIQQEITVDGIIDETTWQEAPWSELFIDIEGDRRPRPAKDTRMKILWSDTHLYFAIELQEEHIIAHQTERNAPIYQFDNDIEVFIDPNGDHHNYYELELNAYNTIWELSLPIPYRDGGIPKDPDPMKGMQSAVKINGTLNNPDDKDISWTVEIAFPWEAFKKYDALHLPPAQGDAWRINLSRVQWLQDIKGSKYVKRKDLKENNWVWSPQHEINMHAPEHWGYLHFIDSIETENSQLDIDHIIEQNLMRLYVEQKRILKETGSFWNNTDRFKSLFGENQKLSIETTVLGYKAKLSIPSANNSEIVTYYVNQDGKFWKSL